MTVKVIGSGKMQCTVFAFELGVERCRLAVLPTNVRRTIDDVGRADVFSSNRGRLRRSDWVDKALPRGQIMLVRS